MIRSICHRNFLPSLPRRLGDLRHFRCSIVHGHLYLLLLFEIAFSATSIPKEIRTAFAYWPLTGAPHRLLALPCELFNLSVDLVLPFVLLNELVADLVDAFLRRASVIFQHLYLDFELLYLLHLLNNLLLRVSLVPLALLHLQVIFSEDQLEGLDFG